MRLLVAIALLALCGAVYAGDTFRFDRGIVSAGDTVAQLVQKGGKPDRTVQLENKFGAGRGERWEYYLPDGKMVSFYVNGGRVVSIEET